MEKIECDEDDDIMSVDKRHDVFAPESEHISPPLLPFLCSCGNQACPIEHDGIYCSIDCAHHDTYQALVNGSSTSHYHRIQKMRRSSSLSPPDSVVELACSEKGQVIAKTDALHDHAYMSIEEWAAFDTDVEDITSPSDAVDATWKKAGEVAQKHRKAKAADAQSTEQIISPYLDVDDSDKTSVPQLSTPPAFPRRPRGRVVDNVRPIL
ncbi:hypothetical protein Clacol_000965 [Clathrus columnatus]|uniref:Uncharacterized protein n=1 Tax=Clathrus columnatus TaxID=1419009 RepID=A0AAV5A0G6_9AGAM|nr:hypothetical protein Clacol_000965 [Clathrus columnatus]